MLKLLKWFFLAVIVLFGIVFCAAFIEGTQLETKNLPTVQDTSQIKTEKAEPVKQKPTPVVRLWDTSTEVDEMTGELVAYAHSKSTSPTKKMDFPYSDVRSWVGVGCKGEKEWAYVGFSNSPNLINDDAKDGYSVMTNRIKWDDDLTKAEFTQTWGDRFLNFRLDAQAIQNIQKYNEFTLELQWHGNGNVLFKYRLKDSSHAIQEMRNLCKK